MKIENSQYLCNRSIEQVEMLHEQLNMQIVAAEHAESNNLLN